MIINVHEHPYDPKSTELLFPYFSKFATARHLLDGTPVDRGGFLMTPEQSIQEMDGAGVDKTVILNSCVVPNEHIYETYLKPFPGRFIGFTGSSPIVLDGTVHNNQSFNQKNWENTRYSLKNLGFTGIKMVPAYEGYSPLDPRVYPYYALASELKVPMTIHMGMTGVSHVALRYARPLDLDQVLFEFPNLRINLPHLGAPWEDEMFSIMVRSPNLYTDISYVGEVGLKRVARKLVTARDFAVLDRVMFGTDPLCRPVAFYVDWVKKGLNQCTVEMGEKPFTPAEIDGILGGTAVKFLGLDS